MCSVRPVPLAEPDHGSANGERRGEVVPLAAHRTVVVVHQPRRRPALMVAPVSRHRREDSPGCLRSLLTAGIALAGWVLAWVRRTAAHLCRRLVAVRTACGAAAV